MTNELIEAVRAAIANALVWEVESDVRAGELTHEEQTKVAQAALAVIEARGMLSQGWQDIASAPVGVVVWAYGTIEGAYGYTEDRKDMVKAVKEPTGKWRFAQPMGRHDPLFWVPDAWQPLPAPPVAAAEIE